MERITASKRGYLLRDNDKLRVETRTNFRQTKETEENSRQKYYVACSFKAQNTERPTECGTGCCVSDVYYGTIEFLLQVQVQFSIPCGGFRKPSESTYNLVQIRWAYGLKRDKVSRVVYKALSNVNSTNVIDTVEDVQCIQRVIGYMDHNRKRCFLDPEWRNLLLERSGHTLKGFS